MAEVRFLLGLPFPMSKKVYGRSERARPQYYNYFFYLSVSFSKVELLHKSDRLQSPRVEK